MKILLVGPSSPLRGGIANFNDSLYSALDKKHEVHIIGFSLQYPSLFFPGQSQYEQGTSESGIRSEQIINSINPFSWFTTAGKIIKKKPGCLVVHYWMPFFAPALGTIIRLVKKKLDVRVIGLMHNIKPHESMPARRGLNNYFLNSCDGFITLSSKVLDDLKDSGINKPVKLIPHPVYDIFGEPVSRQIACDYLKLDPESNYMLFFGIIRHYKGLDLLLKSIASQKLSHLNLKLIVAGEFYENEKRYLDMVKELGLDKQVLFTGSFIPKGDVRHYFAVSDLVVLPYLRATQSGITPVAYHFNKPVLVTNVGGLKEVVPHGRTGYVCEKDPDEIAAAITDFFDNNRSPEFIENIKTEKKKFSWDAMVRGIEDLAAEISGFI